MRPDIPLIVTGAENVAALVTVSVLLSAKALVLPAADVANAALSTAALSTPVTVREPAIETGPLNVASEVTVRVPEKTPAEAKRPLSCEATWLCATTSALTSSVAIVTVEKAKKYPPRVDRFGDISGILSGQYHPRATA